MVSESKILKLQKEGRMIDTAYRTVVTCWRGMGLQGERALVWQHTVILWENIKPHSLAGRGGRHAVLYLTFKIHFFSEWR